MFFSPNCKLVITSSVSVVQGLANGTAVGLLFNNNALQGNEVVQCVLVWTINVKWAEKLSREVQSEFKKSQDGNNQTFHERATIMMQWTERGDTSAVRVGTARANRHSTQTTARPRGTTFPSTQSPEGVASKRERASESEQSALV